MTDKKIGNGKFLLGLTVAVLLPLSFYIVAKLKRKDVLPMPRYYSYLRQDEKGDSVFAKVADIKLVNQSGDTVSLNKDLKGKILVVDVFFTSCTSICPKLTGNMTILQKAFRRNDTTVQLVSISVDPETDSVSSLRAYGERFGANPDHWWFLTGERGAIGAYLRNELKLMVKPQAGGAEQLDHSPTLVLIDKDRYIRGYYNGLDTAELRNCANDIGLLSMQKNVKAKK